MGGSILTRIESELFAFSKLPIGWHYGQGGPIPSEVCTWTLLLYFHSIDLGFSATEVFPGVDGEILICFYSGQNILDFTVNPNGRVDYRHEVNDDTVESVDHLTLEAARQKLTAFGARNEIQKIAE